MSFVGSCEAAQGARAAVHGPPAPCAEEPTRLGGGQLPEVLEGELHLVSVHGPKVSVFEEEAVQDPLLGHAERARVPEPDVPGARELRGFLALGSADLVHGFIQELDHVETSKVTLASGRWSRSPF